MKFWLLKPIADLDPDPWEPAWDKAHGFVVRAESAFVARYLANKQAGNENCNCQPWMDPRQSTCTELTADGPAEVILRDFYSA